MLNQLEEERLREIAYANVQQRIAQEQQVRLRLQRPRAESEDVPGFIQYAIPVREEIKEGN